MRTESHSKFTTKSNKLTDIELPPKKTSIMPNTESLSLFRTQDLSFFKTSICIFIVAQILNFHHYIQTNRSNLMQKTSEKWATALVPKYTI